MGDAPVNHADVCTRLFLLGGFSNLNQAGVCVE